MSSLFVRSLVFAALAGATSAPAQSPPNSVFTSVYSEVSRTRCPNDFNKPLSQLGEHQAITYSCPGRGGYAVDVAYLGAAVRVAIRRSGEKGGKAQLGAGFDVGDRIEWRGASRERGFDPGAAILRLKNREAKNKLGEVLGIVRIEDGKACAAAFIDASANPGAQELARRTADEVAAGPGCSSVTPHVVGATTERVKEAMARAQ